MTVIDEVATERAIQIKEEGYTPDGGNITKPENVVNWIDEQLQDLELIPKHSLPRSDQKAILRAIKEAREALGHIRHECGESTFTRQMIKSAIRQIDDLGS